uniref:C2 domain-containing protein n=1 Tax=Rhodosorus marinus TaxID=101924 RepID=A0A7S2ZXN9_9RHOD|mmetsp:Transcript_36780/g.147108  ORF Transcript_36780/g.147108 Transcript_36780/m.147108 type:complete len:124 (+) Transcript_36780:198-569(+)|eukprot:CAMPEP_0113957834 /NCGR_PEP_ID=MMETSP0011_2-20120614/3001_1 /TAXON_ID=101924 /ORGANISM="Rhodosorus marinus" /LENGTH=123 /DNA_ID=CAMNT_0000968463 /DNA_START=124 /DNA_END=495 /DNA_ORIENTATION=+ /assembly_acc=CAM_ASM_000156
MAGSAIEVWVKSASGLIGPDLLDVPDPYCRVYLDDKQIMKTKHKKNDKSPVWNEKTGVTLTGERQKVRFEVMDKDTLSRDDFVGEAVLEMEEIESSGTVDRSLPLIRKGKQVGVIFIAVNFLQ